jgi:hypothetical protein
MPANTGTGVTNSGDGPAAQRAYLLKLSLGAPNLQIKAPPVGVETALQFNDERRMRDVCINDDVPRAVR